MEISKNELCGMIANFWATKNNDYCLNMTILFLRNIGLKDIEIKRVLDIDYIPKISSEEKKDYNDIISDYDIYF